jgi:mannose-6-phosphate isomerase-like protein (cupin superfamily)
MKKIHEDSLVIAFDASNTDRDAIKLENFLHEMRCVAIKSFATSWSTGNSVVNSAPIVNLAGMFPDLSKVNVTASIVHIEGVDDEEVHYHTSHVIGYVVSGEGQFMVSRDPAFPILDIVAGDVVIIPRGAMHYFVSSTKMDWIALEISDLPIDYQKHLQDHERTGLQG